MWTRHDHFKEKLACGRVFVRRAIFSKPSFLSMTCDFRSFCLIFSVITSHLSFTWIHLEAQKHAFLITASVFDSLRRPAYVLLSFRSYVNSDRFERWLMQLPHIGQYNDHFCILSGNEIIGFVMSQCRKMSFGNRAMHSSMWASWSACWWDSYKQFDDEMKYELSINAGDFLSASHTEI